MSATKGRGFSPGSRARLTICCIAVVALVFAAFTSPASAKAKKIKKPKNFYYLVLGDSISYGFSLVKFSENVGACGKEGTAEKFATPTAPGCEPPSAFEPGFTKVVLKALPKKGKKDTVVNLSCPKETSAGLIGTNPTLGGNADAEHAPCAWHNKLGFARHSELAGSASQLEAAIAFANAERPASNGGHNFEAINAVTIGIGSNDEIHVLTQCQSAAYRTAHSFSSEEECVKEEAPALIGKIITNVGDTVGALRAGGKYVGPIVVLGFYNPFGVLKHATDAIQEELNAQFVKTIETEKLFGPRVKYANPFGTINAGGVGAPKEKEALEKYTEFYNPFAINDERVNVIEKHENAELAGVTAFEEAEPVCVKVSPGAGEFEDAKCEHSGGSKEYVKTTHLAAVIAGAEAEKLATITAEAEGEPVCVKVSPGSGEFEDSHCTVSGGTKEYVKTTHLAAVIAAEEAAHLAAITTFQEEHGNCIAVTPGTGEFEFPTCEGPEGTKGYKKSSIGEGHPNLAELEAFCEAYGCEGGPTLAEADMAAEAAFFHNCEVTESREKAECEAEWTGGAKAATEAAVDAGFDAGVKAAFDHAVKLGFDAAVKAGFDAAVKAGFDSVVKHLFDAQVKEGFVAAVQAGFEAAGSPGDIHPSKAGYEVLGNTLGAAVKGL